MFKNCQTLANASRAPARARGSQRPFITWTVATIAMLLAAADWGGGLAYDRGSIAAGQVWRLATGHLTHWNADHLVWDVLMFALLGTMLESRGRRALVSVLILSTAAISATLWFVEPTVVLYRGLSGIDTALFTLAALELWDEARGGRRLLVRGALVALLVGLLAKLGYEVATGATLFVDSSSAGFTPLPLVHAVGVGAGVLVAWSGKLLTRQPRLVSLESGHDRCQTDRRTDSQATLICNP